MAETRQTLLHFGPRGYPPASATGRTVGLPARLGHAYACHAPKGSAAGASRHHSHRLTLMSRAAAVSESESLSESHWPWFTLKVYIQDNELIPNFSDYILLLQFITEEGRVKILLNSLLDYVKQIYLMISHFLFPAMT